uniref:Uncharacterized protein n=1 Tax=Timema shepardi TaxID=629360 RepID=A0A7R9G5A7_TIMSH|nr:unnamed protein product [Timema shepardi]
MNKKSAVSCQSAPKKPWGYCSSVLCNFSLDNIQIVLSSPFDVYRTILTRYRDGFVEIVSCFLDHVSCSFHLSRQSCYEQLQHNQGLTLTNICPLVLGFDNRLGIGLLRGVRARGFPTITPRKRWYIPSKTIPSSLLLHHIHITRTNLKTSGKNAFKSQTVADSRVVILTFLGTWYNIKRSSNARVTYKCFQNHFSTNEEGAVSMMTKYYNTSSASYISFPGVLNKMDAASPEAKFNLVRSDQANSFHVLGTDYTNYAVMWWCGPKRNTTEHIGEWAWREDRAYRGGDTLHWRCHSYILQHWKGWGCNSLQSQGSPVGTTRVTWVSSRSKTLDAKYQAKADQVLPPGDYLASDQSGCP